jgi:HEPN domain-containing protein
VVSRARDWFRQSLRDLELAERIMDADYYEWACFVAQQAAEKAVKALYQHLGMEVWGHSVSRMLEELPDEHKPPRELIDKARELDRHYGPTRYPNFHVEGAPADYYSREDAERAVKYARMVIDFVRSKGLQA